MKKCPFCAEEIQDAAIKCRFCGESIDPFGSSSDRDRPWYFRNGTVILALLCLTVFALPLVWFNPYYSRKTKAVVTVITLVLTCLMWMVTANAMRQLESYYKMIL